MITFVFNIWFADVCAYVYFVPFKLKIIMFSLFFSRKTQDLPDPDPEKGERSVFYLLLKMFVSSNSNYLKTSTRMLVLKVSFILLTSENCIIKPIFLKFKCIIHILYYNLWKPIFTPE